MSISMRILDGNTAAASIAYRVSDVIAIYPITPSSPMAEQADAWSAIEQPNIWGDIPNIVEMQSEGGAIGAVHGALQTGAMATSFTSSQGLLLMIPNLYKIAGELTPFVLHVAARSIATHALSIFCDHSDVMAVRQTGCAILSACSVQEAHDFAAIAHMASLSSRIPFIHFFDGFRTSHEINKINTLTDEQLAQLIDINLVMAHRQRALTPDHPSVRGTAANPDTFFQAREASNNFYDDCPGKVVEAMAQFFALTGRKYQPFEYYGHPQAERLIVLMGSAAETVEETIDHLLSLGEKVGGIRVRLYRPFSIMHLLDVVPVTVKNIAVLDRTKEPGAVGEPLYQDVLAAFSEARANGRIDNMPHIIGGRYGLSSKEFTPACVKAVFEECTLAKPKQHFTVGIIDDVTYLSLAVRKMPSIDPIDRISALFYGLGSDGTVSANKNSIKMIGEIEGKHAQGYFVYDSKKAGGLTISHLRFGNTPIRSPYLIENANFVACHQFEFINKYVVTEHLKVGGTLLLNAPYASEHIWDHLPKELQADIIKLKAKFYVINATQIASECKLGKRINTVMQMAFFTLTDIFPIEDARNLVKQSIKSSYGKAGQTVIDNNCRAVDLTIQGIEVVNYPDQVTTSYGMPPTVSVDAPNFVQTVSSLMMAGKGDCLPVSAFPVDGSWPTGTTRWEKRNIANEIPIWDRSELCTQCNQCVVVCPHAAIRAKIVEPENLASAPAGLPTLDVKSRDYRGEKYILQVAPEDCTGCQLCVEVCPAKDRSQPEIKSINMKPRLAHLDQEREQYEFFLKLPEKKISDMARLDVRTSQLVQPLFEYSGACSGCGETPYIKILTQLVGDRLLIANATGCSSIYGGNLPTTPYTTNDEGRGPAWANSLFEDNAEFGLGYRLTLDSLQAKVKRLLLEQKGDISSQLIEDILSADQSDANLIQQQRERVDELKTALQALPILDTKELLELSDYLVEKSVWLVGGDGWAYDIGFGGIDHVLSQPHNVNVLVLDTQCYSNTGGQQSKATPLGAVAKFAAKGKRQARKDLGVSMMMYGNIYVAQISLGAQMNQTIKAIKEAEAYPGPSLIIAYSPCGEHGYDLKFSQQHQQLATESGFWPLYRFDPQRVADGKVGLSLDSKKPKRAVREFMEKEVRFTQIFRNDPELAAQLIQEAQDVVNERYNLLSLLALKRDN
ncbi:MAG: pyruvate:ferredoxin (flavodoxin) oxidoreductase [Moritella sp.]|uniref:pyruvate:ferredoxin (flavodoxin) oxidoreductase n=1 Tax=Moritella sp. TaxID=78556 RepID=UPI0029BB9D56|nr:pyruvate:ferredoxin (flavodoxin) oxidoreductase [Moritella sp.]MDX2322426.1 pyruvate:ferredoxin (flavodoxin) oxidoreductase [Moritella sp.]